MFFYFLLFNFSGCYPAVGISNSNWNSLLDATSVLCDRNFKGHTDNTFRSMVALKDRRRHAVCVNQACQTRGLQSCMLWPTHILIFIKLYFPFYYFYCLMQPRSPAKLNAVNILHLCVFLHWGIYSLIRTNVYDAACCGPRCQVEFMIWLWMCPELTGLV